MSGLPKILRPLVDFALPPRCPSCGVTVEDDLRFCLSCWQEMDFIAPPWCAGCGVPFAYDRPGEPLCAHCLTRRPDHDGVRAAVIYDDQTRTIPIRLKYGGRIGHARLIARHLERFCEELSPDTLLVPVPLHWRRQWLRGFNQAQLIAVELGKATGMAVAPDLLKRTLATPRLKGMSPKERARVVGKAFALSKGAGDGLAGRPVILVDDVYTSGATANACARQLKAGGAALVYVFCWARVVGDIA